MLVEVTDTGLGIAPDKLDFIFQEFGRVGGSETPGAGLGLAISRLLAQALGGRITVASELGRGSTFTLWLPLVPGTGGKSRPARWCARPCARPERALLVSGQPRRDER